MRACLLLGIVGALISTIYGDCDACLDGHCYRKHLLPGTSNRFGAVHRKTNTLYHYYRNSDHEEFIIKCNLDMATCNDSAKISNVVDLTVDQRTGDIYGDYYESIYKLNFENGSKALWVATDTPTHQEIWVTAFKDKLYYSAMSGGIYVFENGVSTLLPGTQLYDNIKLFMVDKNDDIYFNNDEASGRVMRKFSKGVVYHTGLWDGHSFAMAIDKDDNLILIDQMTSAVYRLVNGVLVEIGAVTWLRRPLFDRDNNLIYYELNSNKDIEAWHFKKESNIQCTVKTSNLFNRRIITETIVSNGLMTSNPLDTAPAHARTRPKDTGATGGDTHPAV